MEGDFSQRMGFRPLKPEIQLADINVELRHSLWNVLTEDYLAGYAPKTGTTVRKVAGSNRHRFANIYYAEFKKIPTDQIAYQWREFLIKLKNDFLSAEWHRLYSLIEFIVKVTEERHSAALTIGFNRILEREGSGYRIVDGKVCPITSPEEMAAIEEALHKGSDYSGIAEHLSASIRMLSDKQNPDYRNSIKESISAVESVARHITGDANATLGQAVKVLEKKHKLHSGLKTAFSALYGYTNDADGIRHSLMDDSKILTSADARFMLICCSAFINFTIDSLRD